MLGQGDAHTSEGRLVFTDKEKFGLEPSPLDLSFLSFLTFLRHGIEELETQLQLH